jgi:ABC-type nitrate/sulfonate/bicarbonate transport system ATPase subunit
MQLAFLLLSEVVELDTERLRSTLAQAREEPVAIEVREELRCWLRHLHDELHATTLFVTHDQEEAFNVDDLGARGAIVGQVPDSVQVDSGSRSRRTRSKHRALRGPSIREARGMLTSDAQPKA